jgi:hypothetical protein
MTFEEDRDFMNKCIKEARKAIEKTADVEGIDLAFYTFKIEAVRLDAEEYKYPLIKITDEEPR